jgi:tol-pal system protein YbgF
LTVLEKATFNQTTSGLSSNLGSNYDSIITKQSIQITEIQNEIQKLTSQLEEILFSMQTTINTFNTFKEDTDLRFDDFQIKQSEAIESFNETTITQTNIVENEFNNLEPKILGTIQEDENGIQNLADQQSQSNDFVQDEKQEIVNTIAQDNLVKLEENNNIISILPEGDESGQYEFAMNLLKEGDYQTAEQAFVEFISIGKDENFLSNSRFWLGETYYVRENYKDAAKSYLALYQSYPYSTKAPNALLKLGISLIKMDQKEQGCITFIQLEQNYPSADQALLDRNLLEIKNNGCEIS